MKFGIDNNMHIGSANNFILLLFSLSSYAIIKSFMITQHCITKYMHYDP